MFLINIFLNNVSLILKILKIEKIEFWFFLIINKLKN